MTVGADVAVLVLNWNGRQWLLPCIEALLAQDFPRLDVFVIDNGSVDGSLESLAERFPSVSVIRHAHNLGFGTAYNGAIRACRSPFVALLNTDTLVEPGWIGALAEDLQGHPEAAAVGSKLLFMTKSG